MEKPNKRDLSYLSKSLFLRGLQCPKSLYLYKTQPDLRDEISEAQEAVFQAGTEVGVNAQGLFPGGKVIPYDGMSLEDQKKLTQSEIAAGTPVLYEPAFQFDKVFVKADILRKSGEEWDLYEVKGVPGSKTFTSTTLPSSTTSLRIRACRSGRSTWSISTTSMLKMGP